MKMFLIPGDYLKLVLQGSYMSNADKIKLSGPNKEKFLQDIKVRNWMIKRYLLSTCRLSKSNSHPNIQSTFWSSMFLSVVMAYPLVQLIKLVSKQ